MLRVIVGVLRQYPKSFTHLKSVTNRAIIPKVSAQITKYSTILQPNHSCTSPLLANDKIKQISSNIVSRSVTKYSWRKGKRKTVKPVLKRFYRLHWGAWIRTKCGRHKKLWKKTPQRKRRLRQHVFCNATQSMLLDKMVGSYWRKPKYYVDDPYEPYHRREEFQHTYVKHRPYIPNE